MREITKKHQGSDDIRWTASAIYILQAIMEDYMVGMIEDAYLCTQHAKRVTMMQKDIWLARRIRGPSELSNIKEIM